MSAKSGSINVKKKKIKEKREKPFVTALFYAFTKLPASTNTLMTIIHLTITVSQLENDIAIAIAITIAHDSASVAFLVFLPVFVTVSVSASVPVTAF